MNQGKTRVGPGQRSLDNGEEGEAEERDDQKRQSQTGEGAAWSEQAAENFIGCVERCAHPPEEDDMQQGGLDVENVPNIRDDPPGPLDKQIGVIGQKSAEPQG